MTDTTTTPTETASICPDCNDTGYIKKGMFQCVCMRCMSWTANNDEDDSDISGYDYDQEELD